MGAPAAGPALITPSVPTGAAQGSPPGPSLPAVAGRPCGPQSHLGSGRGADGGPGPRGEQPGLGRCAAHRRARAPDPARRPLPADPSPDTRRQLPSQLQRLRAMAARGARAGARGARAGARHTPHPTARARSAKRRPAGPRGRFREPAGRGRRAPPAPPPRRGSPLPPPASPRVPESPARGQVSRAGQGGGRGARGPGPSLRARGKHLSETGCKAASARSDLGAAPAGAESMCRERRPRVKRRWKHAWSWCRFTPVRAAAPSFLQRTGTACKNPLSPQIN